MFLGKKDTRPVAYSEEPTPYAVYCKVHGKQYMVREFYMDQLLAADSKWVCPRCFRETSWDDKNYEDAMDKLYGRE
jgi:hypothetical protein